MMKTTLVWTMILFTLSFSIGLPHTAADDSTKWSLPEGAKNRLGKGVIQEVAYSPDGRLIAVAGSIGIWLYDAETYQEHALLAGHTDRVTSISFSPDGKTLASGSWDRTMRLWDVEAGTPKETLKQRSIVFSVSFSPDGKTLASAEDWRDEVRLWDVETATLKQTLKNRSDVYSVSFSPDGRTLAAGNADKTVSLWDITTATTATLKHTLTGFEGPVNSVTFSPDGKTLATASNNAYGVRLWDVATVTQKVALGNAHYGESHSVSFSPDGKTLASASNTVVQLWDVATETLKRTLTGRANSLVYSVAFSPDGNTIAGASGGIANSVRLWDVTNWTLRRTLSGHTSDGDSVSFSGDGNTIASTGWDKVHLWDSTTGTHKHTLTVDKGWIHSVSFSPDGKTIATGSFGVRLWDVATATLKHTLIGHPQWVSIVSFSPDGKTLASVSANEVRLWDVATATLKHTHTGHTGDVFSVSFSPDGNTIASASVNEVLLWDAATGTDKSTFTQFRGHSVSFSPDGNTIAAVSASDEVLLWDVATGTHTNTIIERTDIALKSVSFSPDGKTLAIIGIEDSSVYLWDVASDTLSGTLTGHIGDVHSVSFSPDGKTLASGSVDGTVLLWDLTLYLDIAPETPVPTDDPDPLLTLQSDPFDGSGQDLQSFWQVQNGDKSSWELKDGQLVVDAGFNQNFYFSDTSTRFYQLTDEEQFEVETAMIVEYTPACIVAGIAVYSETGEWVTLKIHLHPNHSRISAQFQYLVQGHIGGNSNNIETPDGTIPSRAGVFPMQLRIKRDGDEYNTWYRLDAQDDWISVGSTIAALQGPVQTGIYVGICNDESQGGSLKVSFDSFRVTTDPLIPVETPEKEEISNVDATVRFSTPPAEDLYVGEQLMLNLNVAGGENIKGYQATVQFDETALRYVSSTNADFLLPNTFVAPPIIADNSVTVAATSFVGEANGDGTLATLTFEIVGQKASTLTLTEVLFSDSAGTLTRPHVESIELIITEFLKEDVNRDGVVDIQDLMLVDADLTKMGEYATDVNEDGVVNIADLVLVAEAQSSNTSAAASTLSHTKTFALSKADVEMWLAEAMQLNLADPKSQRGIYFLKQLLLALAPEETALLANYPNPFNPETWIPYQLAKPAEVKLTIYAADGKLIRTLTLGHQAAGVYHNRTRAAYWNGKNEAGESVASGVYLYTLTAGDFSATRKMLILK